MVEDAGVGPADALPEVSMCPNCTAAQMAIDERKEVRRRLGKTKGSLTRIAINMAKKDEIKQ